MSTAGVSRLIFPSIVGCDVHPLPYYRAKAEAEAVVEASGLDWTIARATQFHSLLDNMLGSLTASPLVLLPRGFQFQPLDGDEYATTLVKDISRREPKGRVQDMGGPERLLHLRPGGATYRRIRRRRRLSAGVPVFGKIAGGFKKGLNTAGDDALLGSVTWEQYLMRKYRPEEAQAAS